MTWNSGCCEPAPPGVDEWTDEHERGATERDRELFQRVAETHPGVVRTLGVLVGELADLDLEPQIAAELGGQIRRLGDKVIDNARRVGG